MIQFLKSGLIVKSNAGKGESIIRTLRESIPVILMLSLMIPVCIPPAFASETFSVGIYQNRPLIFRDSDGVVKGIYADVLNSVAEENDWMAPATPRGTRAGR
jgi:hypothetical protein